MDPALGLPDLHAPDFEAKTTHGDRRPAGFTPVCSTAFIGYQQHAATFHSMHCKRQSLSINSLYAHLVGVKIIHQKFGVAAIGSLRAMVFCPLRAGGAIEEFVRRLQAMQTHKANKTTTPEGWTPGADVIAPPPKTAEAAASRAGWRPRARSQTA